MTISLNTIYPAKRWVSKHHGFTLIEVVLVLAIGGLIFLLAFIAFQQVSVNRRDAERRSTVRQILADAESYAGDSNGIYPCTDDPANWSCGGSTSWTNFRNNYINQAGYQNPSGPVNQYYHYNGVTYPASNISSWFVSNGYEPRTIVLSARAKCENGDLVSRSANSETAYAVWAKLEKGGFCADNQ